MFFRSVCSLGLYNSTIVYYVSNFVSMSFLCVSLYDVLFVCLFVNTYSSYYKTMERLLNTFDLYIIFLCVNLPILKS